MNMPMGQQEFYQVGMSANTTGISVYILGIDDKKYLAETYGKTLGKEGDKQLYDMGLKLAEKGEFQTDPVRKSENI
jgi:hypothetical protein